MASKNRRRALIVTLLIFAIATAAWLLTPGIDPRLVGEWTNVDPTGFAAWRQFNSDGTHLYSSGSINPSGASRASWSVRGKTLTFSQGSLPVARLWAGSVRRWFYDVVNSFRQVNGTEHYTILEVAPASLRIQSHSGAPIEEYRRKP